MTIFSLFRPKTLSNYTPDAIFKSSCQLIPSSRLLNLLLKSLKRFPPNEFVSFEKSFETAVSLLCNDINAGGYGDLTSSEIERLSAAVPSLLPLLDEVSPFTRLGLLDLFLALKAESAREELLNRLQKASNSSNVFEDGIALSALQTLILYFVDLPDVRSFQPLRLVWARISKKPVEVSGKLAPFLVTAFGLLATTQDHTQSLQLLEKASHSYDFGVDVNSSARGWVERAKEKRRP